VKKQIKDFNLLTNVMGNDNILLQRDNGTTFRAHISSIGASVIDITYNELVTLQSTQGLTIGSYYLITDFRTCYDQPDYDVNNTPITTGIYKEADIEPLMVLALDVDVLSQDAYQPLYPNDSIKYDITWNTTEVTSGEAYGRITERIDEYNNRTDYDHRTILFKRYKTYFPSDKQQGIININDANVIGTNTLFTELTVGDVIYANNLNFKITSITDDLNMTIEGIQQINITNLDYYKTSTIEEDDNLFKCLNWKKNNIIDDDYYREYKTFQTDAEIEQVTFAQSLNNYIGNYSNIYQVLERTFLLANNVLGKISYSNTIGDISYNNSMNDWFNSNTIHNEFNENVILDTFSSNNILNVFARNNIFGQFNNNKIDDNYLDNILYTQFNNNNIGYSFSNNVVTRIFNHNTISSSFTHNLTYNDFIKNNIGHDFNNNYLYSTFLYNIIENDFYNNTIWSEFEHNTIANSFKGNMLGSENQTFYFKNNVISNFFKGNVITGGNVEDNNIGDMFTINQLYGDFIDNNIKHNVISNSFQVSFTNNIIFGEMSYNEFGEYCTFNNIKYNFNNNNIGTGFNNNNIGNNYENNNIGNNYQNNTIDNSYQNNTVGTDFQNNSIGNGYSGNTIGNLYQNNSIGNGYTNNTIGTVFIYNKIGNGYSNNIIGNDCQNNTLGNQYISNTIGNSYQNNIVYNGFINNIIGDVFRFIKIECELTNTNFTSATHVYGSFNCTIFKANDNNLYLQFFNGQELSFVSITS
jgi:hypothetical protein